MCDIDETAVEDIIIIIDIDNAIARLLRCLLAVQPLTCARTSDAKATV